MKLIQRILILTATLLLLAACSPKADETPILQFDNPYAPQPADSDMMYGDITVDSASVFMAKSQPPQLMVNFSYFLPTPCHQLRVEVSGPDAQNNIALKAYGVTEKDKACVLMMPTTPQEASLNLGSLPGGHYTISLNGDQIGEFDS